MRELSGDNGDEVRQRQLVDALKLDKSTISTRVRAALDTGYLVNREEKRGRPHRLALGDPLPDDLEILPQRQELDGWTIDGRDGTPPSPQAYEENSSSEIAREANLELAARADALQERFEQEGWE